MCSGFIDGRVAQDSLFIIFGFIGFLTNLILMHDAKYINKEENKHQRLQETGQQTNSSAYLQNTNPPVAAVISER